ncbi:MAG: hypothetical protein FWC46_09455, partial [Actinomycetia bacterium]|nr:hypothetical protein [Actinomycetes bacterium]
GGTMDQFWGELASAEAAVNQWMKDMKFSPEDQARVESNIAKILSAVGSTFGGPLGDALGGLGTGLGVHSEQTAAGQNKAVEDALQDDASTQGTAGKPRDVIDEALGESAPDTAKKAADALANAAAVKAWIDVAKMMGDEFMRDKAKWEHIRDGVNAARTLQQFYDKLNQWVADYLAQHPGHWQIEFKNAQDTKPFTLYGASSTESWTVAMTLVRQGGTVADGWPGTYGGDYQFNVTYDMATWRDQLPSAIYNMTAIGTGLRSAEAMLGFPFTITVTNPGTCSAKRELIGGATATVAKAGASVSVTLSAATNTKTIAMSGIAVDVNALEHAGAATLNYDLPYTFSADENSMYAEQGTYSSGYALPGASGGWNLGGGTIPLPWEGDIWKRSDQPTASLTVGGA